MLVSAVAPWLLEVPGVGPLSAAQVLVSWSHAGRSCSEAAFAALAGTSPIPASSGQVACYRLNRALPTILLVRLRTDPDTWVCMARRTAEGNSRRDAKRCLRRVIARQLFRLLERYDRPGVEILRRPESTWQSSVSRRAARAGVKIRAGCPSTSSMLGAC